MMELQLEASLPKGDSYMNSTRVINNKTYDRLAPIIIGVTGHRDLRDQDVRILEDKVQGIIIKIGSMYLNSPLLLISPLAEGADRLVARVGLKLAAEKTIDLRLTALLPMSRGEYVLKCLIIINNVSLVMLL